MSNFFLKATKLTLVVIAISACSRKSNIPDPISPLNQENYYKKTPDAPLKIYCNLNDALSNDNRSVICSELSQFKIGNLSAEFIFHVNKSNIDSVQLLYIIAFDSLGIPRKDTSLTVQKIALDAILAGLTRIDRDDGDYAMRIQLERFCPGHDF